MLRLTLAVLMIASLVFAAKADVVGDEKPVRLQDVDLDIGSLRGWGTRTYSYQIERDGKRTTLGTVTMNTKVSDDGIRFDDRWDLMWRGERLTLHLTMECRRDSLLRPRSIRSVGEGDDEVGTFSVEVGADKGTVRMEDGKVREMDFPADTLTDSALFRVFTLLPAKGETNFAVDHVLEVSELHLKGPATIAYDGPDRIELHGKQATLHKFVYRRDDRIVAEAWVDSDHVLRQICLDGRKTLTEKAN